MKTILKRGDLVIRTSEHFDILPIAYNMRHADIEEIWASNNSTPNEALTNGLLCSKPCLTAELKGVPIAMFGLVPTEDEKRSTIWFLGTPEAEKISICFGRLSRLLVKRFLKDHEILFNYVDARNYHSIKWLKWLGAKFNKKAPYGVMNRPFKMFTIEKGALYV